MIKLGGKNSKNYLQFSYKNSNFSELKNVDLKKINLD